MPPDRDELRGLPPDRNELRGLPPDRNELRGLPPDRNDLRGQLLAARIAGDVATPRQSNLTNITKMLNREPRYTFGLTLDRPWSFEQVLAALVEYVGVAPDPGYRSGPDTIDVDRTLAALDAARDRIALAARHRERVLLATGHPAGLLAVHLQTAVALAAAGATLLNPAPGARAPTYDGEHREVRYLGGVAVLSNGGGLNHTHSPRPMQVLLDALDRAGEPAPDLVVADHGWAGAAGQAGIDTVGYADCNDPALFVGAAEGKVGVVVPLDDNVLPHLYEPTADYLTAGITARITTHRSDSVTGGQPSGHPGGRPG